MKYLTENIGRGPKKLLKQVNIANQNSEIIEIITQKDKLEEVII